MGRGSSSQQTEAATGASRSAAARKPVTTADIFSLDGSKALMQAIKDDLAGTGMPRTSGLNGGDITGLTDARGSTGFSVRCSEDGSELHFNVVVSGKQAGISYREFEQEEDDETLQLHEPTNPEILHQRISDVFTKRGFSVKEVESAGYQMMWDDDIEYRITTEMPASDEATEAKAISSLCGQASYRAGRMSADAAARAKESDSMLAYRCLLSVPPDLLAKHLSNEQISFFCRYLDEQGRQHSSERKFWGQVHSQHLGAKYPIS